MIHGFMVDLISASGLANSLNTEMILEELKKRL